MTTQIRKVGVIGLGAMGMSVAQSLLRAGFDVHTFDVRSEALGGRLPAMGLHPIDAPISGGAAKAAAGQMSVMAAGPGGEDDAAVVKIFPGIELPAGDGQ
jgi:3-hydroxyisobutyrate dehydrogenase-like beta-hydroxyacid dehydrogenase